MSVGLLKTNKSLIRLSNGPTSSNTSATTWDWIRKVKIRLNVLRNYSLTGVMAIGKAFGNKVHKTNVY